MRKTPILSIISAIIAVAFTTFIALDTFVFTYVYSPAYDITGTVIGDETSAEPDISDCLITDTSYKDENISITLFTYREYNTDIYVADVILSSPEYLKTALAKSAYGKNITDTTSHIAEDNNAILAINGDYYGVQEKGYVIRNGVLYRNTAKSEQEDLVIYKDGSMKCISENEITAQQLIEDGAMHVLSFGPGLIENGEISVGINSRVDREMSSNPRTAIGIIDDLHYVFVVSDGRTSESEGLSLYNLAQFMKSLNVSCAYNLDGGGSSTMVFNGRVINNPTSGGGSRSSGKTDTKISERSVSDIVCIGY